jgi:type IV fimbrial biogenesis protein FimT
MRSSGFTLTELMMTLVVVGVVATIAVPSFRIWFLNAQIRAAAESISNGMQRARAEAVARNATVDFVLGAGTNTSWTVNDAINPLNPPIDTRSSNEGSIAVTRTVTPAGATTITFNNFGGVTANIDATAAITQVDLAAAGTTQAMRITVGLGGNAKMCDPSLPATNARGC